jgi:alpha-L-arabinofuranosidase
MKRRSFLNIAIGTTTSLLDITSIARNNNRTALQATVNIDPNRELGRIDPKVYGHQLEHLERIVYGGVFDPASPRADKQGLRSDVIQAMKEMGGARVIRWPGGNFASYYHWKDGIGPRHKRPKRYDVVWSTYESNHFGTNEYLDLCRKMEFEPFITVNMGSGTLEEACQWVEYCRLQKRQPPVKIWGLGNEHFGPWQVGHYTAEEYGRKAIQYGQFMKSVQSDLELVGVGVMSTPGWNETVLKHCGELIDYLSIHLYGHRYFYDGIDDYDQAVATPVFFEREIKAMADQIAIAEKSLRRKEPLKICLEEWNTRHNKKPTGLFRESPRNIVDALFVAGVFNACQRLSSRVAMTNYIYFVNAHAPLYTTREGLVKGATFDVFKLYATKMQPVAIEAETTAETFTVELPKPTLIDSRRDQPNQVTASRLDVSATRSINNDKIVISLINRDKNRPIIVNLQIKGLSALNKRVLHTLSAPTLTTVNSLKEPNLIRARTILLEDKIDKINLAPSSVNILEISKHIGN